MENFHNNRNNTLKHNISQQIKESALQLGFDACGIAKLDFLKQDAVYLKNWLEKGNHAEMGYMANHFEKRTNPTLLVENAKSVVVVLLNYFPEKKQDSSLPQIAKYAYGEDYHILMKEKLFALLDEIRQLLNTTLSSARVFVDSAPVLERRWAERAGLGWIGKNTCLIHPNLGSFVFIGEIILDVELSYDNPIENRCGNCTRCLDACPSGALCKANQLNANRCFSYLTIEKKGAIEDVDRLSNRLYGCDTCQDVCPWNTKAKPLHEKRLFPLTHLLSLTTTDWLTMNKDEFDILFQKSPLKRAGLDKLKSNLQTIN